MRSLVGLTLYLPSLLRYMFLLLSFLFNNSSSAFLYIGNIQTKHLYQTSPVAGALIDTPSLPWSVYVYGLDGFAQEWLVSHNINVTSYPFPNGTRVVSSLSFFFYFSCIPTLVLTIFSSKFSSMFRSTKSSFSLQEISSQSWLSIHDSCTVARMSVMIMMMMVVEVEVRSWLQVISRGRGTSSDPANR